MTPQILASLLLPVLVTLPTARAIDREAVLENAAIFTTHQWTMGAGNQTASCSSSYISDYTPGETYRGLPYDWGGWVTTDEFDDYLALDYGAGSHSSNGVLSCTVGVDCSGFVSQTWETSIKYGTSTFYQVSSEISVTDLKRADALNNAGSHIVLFAYQTAAGLPVYFESGGALVSVHGTQGWSYFSNYTPIRYDDISDGAKTGTFDNPIEISQMPFEDLRYTAGAASDAIDVYSCSSADESGPEQIYHFEVATAGTLSARVSDDDGVDIDLQVLSEPQGDACLARDDTELELWLEPGEYWLVADTWVSSYEYAGPYILTMSFTGSLGSSDGSGDPGTGTGGSDGGGSDGGSADTGAWDAGSSGGDAGSYLDSGLADDGVAQGFASGPPGQRFSLVEDGSGCASAPGPMGFWALGLALLLPWRRRSGPEGSVRNNP
ncbi:MAG: hypothetical protein GXP62_09135 [Oligoflexia bacterium]|nr:hypothetical protein [Oligoflexia bacterium]